MEEVEDSDSDKTVRLEDYHKISWRRRSKSLGGVRNVTGMEESGDSYFDKTLRVEDYHCQPETIPLRRLTEEHGGIIQNVATAPNEYVTTPNAYFPSYELARDVGKQLVIESSSNDNQESQYSNSTRCELEIKRELLNQVSDDVQDNARHTDNMVIEISDDEQSDQTADEKEYAPPLYTPVIIKNDFETGDLELTANETPPPITNVKKPEIRIKVLNPKDINEQAAAKIYSEVSNHDKTNLNKNIVSSSRSSDGESMDNLIKDLTILCKSNNSTVYALTSNDNVSSSSVIETVAENTSDKISESTNKNWEERANAKEDNTRNIKVNTTEIVAKSAIAERVKSPENSMSEKGNRHVESNKLLNMNVEETRRRVNRLSDKNTLPITCMRTDQQESTKNTLHSVFNNDVIIDTNNHINTNILDLCTLQRDSQNAHINEQKEKEINKTQNLKASCGDNLKNLTEKKSILKFLSRFCSVMMEHLLEKWKSLSEEAENKNAFSKSARLLADEIKKLDALEKADVQLNCPVCSRISTFTGIDSYDYYKHDTEGKQKNRFKKCYLCYGFQKNYNAMIKPLLPIQSNKSDGAKSFESSKNILSQKDQPIRQKIGTPLKYSKDADNEATVSSLSKSEISVFDISPKRDNDNNRNECSAETINNKNKLEIIKHNTSLPEIINKETDVPSSIATLENKNNISQITDNLTLEGNISAVATKDSVGSEATSIETVHRTSPGDVVISASLKSIDNNNLEHIVDKLKSKASDIPAKDTNLSKTMSQKLDNVDKYHKVENNITKTNILSNLQERNLISTTTSVDCPIVKTPYTEPKPIFLEIKGNAKYVAVDKDSRSATPLPIVMEKIKKDHANVLRPGVSSVSEGTYKPVIEKSTEKVYDINKTISNNNDIVDHRVDNLMGHKRKNKEMHIKAVKKCLITRTSDTDFPSTLSNIKANISKDMSVQLKNDDTNRPRQIDKLVSESTSVTTQKSSKNVQDENMSITSFDNDISDHRVNSSTTKVKNLSDTVKARRKSKETPSRSVSENQIGKPPDENLPSLSNGKDHSPYNLGNIMSETPKVMPRDRCLSEESSIPSMAAKSKNDGTNQLETADRLGGKNTLVTSAIKPSSGTENNTIVFKTSNDNDISDHRVDSITTDVKSLSDTAKVSRNSKEMFENKDHSNDKLGNINANTSTAMSVDRCQNISKDVSSDHLKRKGDELVSKGTSLKFAIKSIAQRMYDVKICKTSSNVDVSDHSIDNVHVLESKTRDTKVQDKQLSKGVHKRRVSSKLNNEDLCNTIESDLKKQKIGASLVNPTLSRDSSGVAEERHLTKEKPQFNIHPTTNNDVSNSKNLIPKEANILTLRAGDKKGSGVISVGTQDSIVSKRKKSTPSNNDGVLNPAVDSARTEKRDVFASPHPNDKNFSSHDLDKVSKTTTITAASVHSLVPESNNKTNILPVKATKRRISTDTSVSNIPPKIYKDQIGNTTVLSPSKPEASKEHIITSVHAELKSKKSNHSVIIDSKAADIVSTNNRNKTPRAGIFIDDEASTKKYYDNTHQRVERVVTETNHFALEAENGNHSSSLFASVPTEATAMSSREKMARLLPPDEDDKDTSEMSITNNQKIANDETATSPKCMKTKDVKFRTNDDVGNALSNKSPKNNIERAMNHALTVNEPLASVHLSRKNNPIEIHIETTIKKPFDDSSIVKHDKGHNKSEMLTCEDDEVINNPVVNSMAISNDSQTKHITSETGQNTKLTDNHADEESNKVDTNKDDHKPYEGSIIKKTNERPSIKTLQNDENRDRAKKVVEKDSAKREAENSDGDSANGSVNVKENEASELVLNSLENRYEKSTTLVEAEATLFLETSKKIINSKILYECPICSCIFQDSNIYLGHLKSDHNLITPVVPETVELNNNSNKNDEAESVNKLNNSVSITGAEVNVQHVERVSTPLVYMYKCSLCDDTFQTYYSARTHKREFHPKKKYIKIYEKILVDCETGKQIMDTNHTCDDVDNDDDGDDDDDDDDDDDENNENKEATENEVCAEDSNIEDNNSSDNDENNEVRSNMSIDNVVIISDEEAVDEQSTDVEQQNSDVSSSSPSKNNHEKISRSNGKDCSTSDPNANSPNGVVCEAGASDENKKSLSDNVNHGHEISFIKQDNIHKSIDKSDANSVNKDSKNGHDMEVEEETREGRSEDNDEQIHYGRNIKPNDENVVKYGYKCKICDEELHSKYAALRHREIKHSQMRNRQLFKRVLLSHLLNNQEKLKNINIVGKSIPIGDDSLQSVSVDNLENRMKEKAQPEPEDNQQKNKDINSDQEQQGKERDYESNKTNSDKLHTNNHDSTEKLSNAPESSSSTHNSHNLVKILCAGISHVNQKGSKESSNNEDQIDLIIHNSNDNIVSRQILSSTVCSNIPNKLSSHDPMGNNVNGNEQRGSKQKEEDKTNGNQTVHDSETNNRQTGDEIAVNQTDHEIIQTKKLPVSPDAYVLSCLECGYTTEICDSVIRHCQNHYNDVKDQTTHCTICQLNFDTDNFESHQNLHGKHVAFEVVKYSYKSLFSDWDKIFDEISSDTVKDFRKKSIYKTNCIKMAVKENGPWEDSLYVCGQCSTCVPQQEIQRHFQENCYFVSYPCAICRRYFASLEMLVEHERNHSKSYRVIAFNNIKDKKFNCKLLEARKNQQDLMNEIILATIYKCACELCFATSNSFKIHFIECDFTRKNGVLCTKCTVPLHFQARELENHEELHHSATKCKFLVYHVTVNEEKVPDVNDGHNTAEMDTKRDLLKHDTTDSQQD